MATKKYHIVLDEEEMRRLLDMLKNETKRHVMYGNNINPIDIHDKMVIEKIRKVWHKEMEKQYNREKEELIALGILNKNS